MSVISGTSKSEYVDEDMKRHTDESTESDEPADSKRFKAKDAEDVTMPHKAAKSTGADDGVKAKAHGKSTADKEEEDRPESSGSSEDEVANEMLDFGVKPSDADAKEVKAAIKDIEEVYEQFEKANERDYPTGPEPDLDLRADEFGGEDDDGKSDEFCDAGDTNADVQDLS